MRRFLLATLIATSLAAPLRAETAAPDVTQWQASRALADIERQVSFGARAMDTPGHQKTVDLIEAELRALGLEPKEQRWHSDAGGQAHELVNIIAPMFPERSEHRMILGSHYDSIIRAYRDQAHPEAVMPGANNSASGVALLLETVRALKAQKSPPPHGIDFVFFDGEEGPVSLGAGDPHWQALGSPYFAAHLGEVFPAGKPQQAAIFDMVCWREEKLRPEQASLLYAPDEIEKFWNIGRTFAPAYFATQPTPEPIFDDQIALDQAGIRAFLVIGFEYEPWFNTTGDTPDKCAEAALTGVGRTVLRYIYAP
jgi:glutaminyl-peptide cyclotransferase